MWKFSGDLSASTNSGNVQWYGAATGGSVSYQPIISHLVIVHPIHVNAASSGCPSSRTGITATVNANPTPSASASPAGFCDSEIPRFNRNFRVSIPSMGSGHCSATGSMTYATSVTNFTFDGTERILIILVKQTPTEDYTSSNVATGSPKGSSANISMRVNTDGNYTVHGKIWIDLNNDDDFNDAGEEFDMGDATNVAKAALQVPVQSPSLYLQLWVNIKMQYLQDMDLIQQRV